MIQVITEPLLTAGVGDGERDHGAGGLFGQAQMQRESACAGVDPGLACRVACSSTDTLLEASGTTHQASPAGQQQQQAIVDGVDRVSHPHQRCWLGQSW